jgi:acyl-CoA hydrolase
MIAEIKTLGKSSIQIKISVSRESIQGFIEDICAANFTFVAMKDKKSYPHGLNFDKLEIKDDE